MFLTPDGTFWVQLVNFAIFYAILYVVFLRPVQSAIAKRREYIEGLTHEYDRAQAEATELRARAEQVRADARSESDHLVAAARNEGGNEAAKLASDYGEKVRQIVDDADRQVASEVEAVRPRERALAQELAESIVGRILPEIHA